MAILIVYQMSAAVPPMRLEQLRRKLHSNANFKMCGLDTKQACVEIPANTIIYGGTDPAGARTLFEEFLRSEVLLSSLEQVIYTSLSNDAIVTSIRICFDGNCGQPAAAADDVDVSAADQSREFDASVTRLSADTAS